MELELANSKGAMLKVSDAVFGMDFKESLVHQVVNAYLAGARAGTHAQKTRSEVRGGGKKPWRQKGTGRARAGTRSSPLWRSGGITFAAKPRDYSQKVNKKMYKGAMRSIVSQLVKEERMMVIEELKVEQPKVREVKTLLQSLKLDNVLIVADEIDENIYLATRNLPHVDLCDVAALNPVILLRHDKLLLTKSALKLLEERLS